MPISDFFKKSNTQLVFPLQDMEDTRDYRYPPPAGNVEGTPYWKCFVCKKVITTFVKNETSRAPITRRIANKDEIHWNINEGTTEAKPMGGGLAKEDIRFSYQTLNACYAFVMNPEMVKIKLNEAKTKAEEFVAQSTRQLEELANQPEPYPGANERKVRSILDERRIGIRDIIRTVTSEIEREITSNFRHAASKLNDFFHASNKIFYANQYPIFYKCLDDFNKTINNFHLYLERINNPGNANELLEHAYTDIIGKISALEPVVIALRDNLGELDNKLPEKSYHVQENFVFEPICEDCATKGYAEFKCAECGEIGTDEDQFVHFDNKEFPFDHYCTDCAEQCSACKDPLIKGSDDIQTDGDGNAYCQQCYDDKFSYCEACGNTIPKNEMNGEYCKDCSHNCEGCGEELKTEGRRPDNYYTSEDGDYYCEECYYDRFGTCDECGSEFGKDDLTYVQEGRHAGNYCEYCYGKKFKTCDYCEETFPKNEVRDIKLNNEEKEVCDSCFDDQDIITPEMKEQILREEDEAATQARIKREREAEETRKAEEEVVKRKEQMEAFKVPAPFTYSKKDKYLRILKRLAPISVKDLKSKYPRLAQSAQDIITFAKGKPLTDEVLKAYENTIPKIDFQMEFSEWGSSTQRSISNTRNTPQAKIYSKIPQMVLNIVAGPDLIEKMKKEKGVYELFDTINNASRASGHPYKQDQLGWIRFDPNISEKYILVDEIQTDHMNGIHRIKTNTYQGKEIKEKLMKDLSLSEEEFNKSIEKLAAIIKEFPDISMKAISDFAKIYGFEKLYWHTYESGKQLKQNEPPKSFYEQTPKEHNFEPTEDKPFGLEGHFFSREAMRKARLSKISMLKRADDFVRKYGNNEIVREILS